MSSRVAVGQPWELVEVLIFELSPVCDMQLRSEDLAFVVQFFGGSLNVHI